MGCIASFFVELRRRKVWLVGGVYVVAAWIILQVATVIENTANLPDWVDMVVLVLLVLGLPLALILAWAQETQATGDAQAVTEREDAELDPKAVAVLPFENLSPDPDNAYFAAGVHEEVLNQLAKIRDLRIIARTSVLQYAENRKTMPEIAAELRVGTIMEGSVRYAGDRVRITAQLIDGTTNSHIWSETYDRNFNDIFGIQSEISLAIAGQLRASLSQEESDSIEKRPTENMEAYSELLKSVAEFETFSADGLSKGVAHLDRAIELDPEFALAFARKAGFTILARSLFEVVIEENTAEVAIEAADKALALDPLLSDAHWAKAHALAYRCKWDEALSSFSRAVDLGPGDGNFHVAMAVHLANMGRAAQAVPVMERALTIDPYNPSVHGFAAHIWAQTGRLEDSAREAELSLGLRPEGFLNHIFLAEALGLMGRTDDAAETLRDTERLASAAEPHMQMSLAERWATIGEVDHAIELVAKIDPATQHAGSYAGYLHRIGDTDGAIDVLTRAFDRDGQIPRDTYPRISLMPLRSDARFQALMAKNGLRLDAD